MQNYHRMNIIHAIGKYISSKLESLFNICSILFSHLIIWYYYEGKIIYYYTILWNTRNTHTHTPRKKDLCSQFFHLSWARFESGLSQQNFSWTSKLVQTMMMKNIVELSIPYSIWLSFFLFIRPYCHLFLWWFIFFQGGVCNLLCYPFKHTKQNKTIIEI